jgi:lipopolysaccharide/colanic/teichoic acid biosynthesis glycosyltransferase
MVPRALEQSPPSAVVSSANHNQTKTQLGKAVPVSTFFRWKRAVDLPLAAILLIPFGPVIGLLWLLVKLGSSGPGFYRQERVCQGGRSYRMLKLRSMRQDAEAATGAVWSTTDDPRVTRLGHVLRTFHLDELPQLFNVLKGEMSLVGPRPERPEFVEVLAEKIPDYRNRLVVPPGITGLAQLNLPPDTDLNSVRRKLVLDLEYVEQADAWMEARLLICTATRLIKVPAIGLFGLSRSPTLAPAADDEVRSASLSETVPISAALQQTLHGSPHENGHKQTPHDQNGHVHRSTRTKPR